MSDWNEVEKTIDIYLGEKARFKTLKINKELSESAMIVVDSWRKLCSFYPDAMRYDIIYYDNCNCNFKHKMKLLFEKRFKELYGK